jgi:putative membrane protein
MNLLIRLALGAFGVLIGAYILPGVHVDTIWSAVVVALILGILNWTVKPLLIMLTIPLTLITMGLFLLVINSIIVLLADYLISGFSVDGFWWALLFSLVLTVLNWIIGDISKRNSRGRSN